MSEAADHCAFCSIVAGATPAAIVHRDDDVVAFLDARPVFPGHVLIVPARHVGTIEDLPDALAIPMLRVVRAVAAAMRTALGAQGSFVATNNRVSQSVPHLHVHVVPRTKGDGLRGFFWPRTSYPDDTTRDAVAAALAVHVAEALAEGS